MHSLGEGREGRDGSADDDRPDVCRSLRGKACFGFRKGLRKLRCCGVGLAHVPGSEWIPTGLRVEACALNSGMYSTYSGPTAGKILMSAPEPLATRRHICLLRCQFEDVPRHTSLRPLTRAPSSILVSVLVAFWTSFALSGAGYEVFGTTLTCSGCRGSCTTNMGSAVCACR